MEGKNKQGDLVREILSELTLDEKIRITSGNPLFCLLFQIAGYGKYCSFNTPALKRFKLPGIRFIDGPRGVCFKDCTAFPVAIARGAAWDADLEQRIGEAMGYEARSRGANLCGSVCINLVRHPSWGRAQEAFGEDPFHTGSLGAAAVRGLQKYVMACVKHLAANSIELSRFYVDIRMEERTLRELFLPHFKKCVDAGAASVMSAYNKLNGLYCGHNRHLLTEILKEEWGFGGFVVSDFLYGIRNTVEAAGAGLDLEMPYPKYYGRRLKRAVLKKKVNESVIDDAASRIISRQLMLPKFEKRPGDGISRKHTELALEAARKSIVLLKNENNILPLQMKKLREIAVVGRLADAVNLGDRGSSNVRPPYTVTPLEGIRRRAGQSIEVNSYTGRRISRAVKIAEQADAVIIIAGFTWKDEGEYIRELKRGGDRLRLDLLERDVRLIEAVSAVNKNCVVVIEAGSAVAMSGWIDRVRAVLMLWYPGMEGGNALADILFGDVNPCGKLPIAFPVSAEQLFGFDNRAKSVEYDRYHGYRYFDKNKMKPLFPFGFGLSYTSYRYNFIRLSKKVIGADEELVVTVNISNEGDIAGEEIAQLYVGYSGSKIDRPVKELRGFRRVPLNPGESTDVDFKISPADLAFWNEKSRKWDIERMEYTVFAGGSSADKDLKLKETFLIE